MLLVIVGLMTLAVTLWLAYYLRTVPEGPLCPRCGERLERMDRRLQAGGSAARDSRLGALLSFRAWTVAARCPACGWDGRMRRGPEAELVRVRRTDRLDEGT